MPLAEQTRCREWHGARTNGYGVIRRGGKNVYLHRWVMAQIHGWGALEGKCVLHHCDNPACFRFDHLYIGTDADNMADKVRRGRHANQLKTHCKNGHSFDEVNTIDNHGGRGCRACRAAASRAFRRRRRDASG